MIDRLRQAGRDARNSSAAIILVLASVISACAAVAGLSSWVTVAAAVAAVLSGGQVLQNELIVPMRIRSTEKAAVRVVSRNGQSFGAGTAFQIAANCWITAQHIIAGSGEILLKIDGGDSPAQILYENSDNDIAVLSVGSKWAWRASMARSLLDPGDQVKAVGWTRDDDGEWWKITLDYLYQGRGEDNKIALTGADHPQIGFSGAPVIDVRSGRVVGIVNDLSLGPDSSRYRDKGFPRPDPIAVIFATLISEIPAKYR